MGLNSAWTRLRAVFLWRPFLSQLAVLLALDLAIHATLLFRFEGYLSWGNFDTAFVASQYPSGPALYWSPFQYNGAPVGLGFADLSNYIEGLGPLTVLSDLLGATWGAKAFILLSTWFVGGAALLLARTVIRRPIAQLSAAVFLIGGPFQLALYGQGDYQAFVAEGFVFLSLYALWLGIRRPTQRWVWFPTAAWLLVLTFQVPQAFLLGFVLTAGLVPLYVRDWRRSLAPAAEDPSSVDGGQPPRSTPSRRWGDRMRATYRWVVRPGGTLSDIGGMLARLPGVVGVAAVIIIPAYVTFYILGTGATGASSGMALPLSTFSQYQSGSARVTGPERLFQSQSDHGPRWVRGRREPLRLVYRRAGAPGVGLGRLPVHARTSSSLPPGRHGPGSADRGGHRRPTLRAQRVPVSSGSRIRRPQRVLLLGLVRPQPARRPHGWTPPAGAAEVQGPSPGGDGRCDGRPGPSGWGPKRRSGYCETHRVSPSNGTSGRGWRSGWLPS